MTVAYESEDFNGNPGVIVYLITDGGPHPVTEAEASERAEMVWWDR